MPSHYSTRTRFTLSHDLCPESLTALKELLHKRFAGQDKAKQKEGMALTRRINSLGKRNFDGKYWRVMTMKGNCLEHRVIMERRLGRSLIKSEQVHHRDENKTNNDPDNIELTSQSKHMSLHRKNSQRSPEFNYRRDGKWSMKHDVCVDCGTTQWPYINKGRCAKCFNAARRTKRSCPNKMKK